MERILNNFEAFIITHDRRKLFLIIYIGGAAIIALACGLFYFALWVVAHLFLEIYKRVRMNSGFSWQDLAIALSHCKVDLSFLFVGLCIDVICHHSIALAAANSEVYLVRMFRVLKAKTLVRLAETMPRVFGTVKASNCVVHLAYDLAENVREDEEPKFQARKSDFISVAIILTSLVLTFIIPIRMGFTLSDVFHGIAEVLSP